MISNTNDLDTYVLYNKIYVPTNYINANWSYKLNGDYITIITNNNCYTQYNSTYCNCYSYNYTNNLITDAYSCNTNNSNATIPYSSITSDINYSSYIRNIYFQDKSILLLIVILGIIFAKFLFKERSY